MQEIVANTVDDLEFLKLTLTIEIDNIKRNIKSLIIYPKVQDYINLLRKKEDLKKNNIYKDPLKSEIKDKIAFLINTYTEVKQYEENIKVLKEYKKELIKIENLISVNGIICNKEKQNKIYYSQKTIIMHLLTIKKEEGLNLQTNIEELNRYIDAVRQSLQSEIHYEDDKVIDEILSYKVYENPHNYDIKNVRELPSIEIEYLSKNNKLTKREKESFFGRNAYESLGLIKKEEYIKRIGVKKND